MVQRSGWGEHISSFNATWKDDDDDADDDDDDDGDAGDAGP